MKHIPLIILVGLMTGCHPNPPPTSAPAHITVSQYQQIHVGMSRDEVYQLLGKPQGSYIEGANVPIEIWVAPPDSHGQKVRLAILFWADGRAHSVDQDILK
jgi:hypothetical protein